jgi:hypothetical protein
MLNESRLSALRTASGHKKPCLAHHLVSARNRSSQLKWKEFEHNCNNMRILESNRKIHESRILSGATAGKENNRMRRLLVDQVGYGQITEGQKDSYIRELHTSRSGGKDALYTGRSAGRDSGSESVNFQTILDQKVGGKARADPQPRQDSATRHYNQMTPHYSAQSAIAGLKLVTP